MVAPFPMKISGPRVLKGPDRVAALLLAMGKPAASRILKHFNADEIRLLSRSAVALGAIPSSEIETLVEEFAMSLPGGTDLFGTVSEVEKLLTGILSPEQVSDIMNEVSGSANRSIWERISGVPEAALASYLLKEHPQTAALILSKVSPASAAKVLAQLPQGLRNNVVRRMLSIKPIVDKVMQTIEKTLHEDFMTNFSRKASTDTHVRLADIINKMEPNHMEDVLADIAQVRPKSAEVLKGLLFTFDDITKLTEFDRAALFDKVPPEKVALALKGTGEEFRKTVLSSLSSRVRRMIEHDLSAKEPAPQREVVDARRSITDMALEMAAKGDIIIHSDADGSSSYV